MRRSPLLKDRAGGVLLGQAIGDALGVPYEFAPPDPRGRGPHGGRRVGTVRAG